MTTLEKTPTLRQFAASALRIVGQSSTARAEYPYAKELCRLGLAPRGHAGRGGTKSPPVTIELAEILTLAIALGIPAKQAVAEALALRTLPIEGSTRWFIWPNSVITDPLPINGAEASNFGLMLQALLRCYQLQWTPEQFQPADSWTLPHGVRFGKGPAGFYAVYERQSVGEVVEGALVIDRIAYGAPYMERSLAYPPVEHGTFIPMARLKLLGEALGPPPAEFAGSELLRLPSNQPEMFIDKPALVAGANLNFDSATFGEA